MTDPTPTETRALIARVRAGITTERQPQTLRDLARTADGEPRVDAGMLRREADGIEDEQANAEADARYRERASGTLPHHLIDVHAGDVVRWLDENDRLRARVAELEAVPGKVTAAHALAMAEARGRRAGAEAMRERAAAHLDAQALRKWRDSEGAHSDDEAARLLECYFEAAMCRELVRALPLDDDALEDAQGGSDG